MPKLTFEVWMQEVDRLLYATVGIGYEDLPDWRWMDEWEEGVTPRDAVDEFRATGMD